MLIKLGLQNRLDTPCARLSLGQQQRVAFVRTLAQPADFFLLDEPISHLDMANAEIMSAMLKERQQKDGAGVIVTSIGNRLPYEYDNIIKL
jgi:putative ABC transport system ATP-binding protein